MTHSGVIDEKLSVYLCVMPTDHELWFTRFIGYLAYIVDLLAERHSQLLVPCCTSFLVDNVKSASERLV